MYILHFIIIRVYIGLILFNSRFPDTFSFIFFLQLNPSCRNRIRLRVYRNGIEILSPIIQHYSQCFTHIRIVHEIIHSERNGFNDQGDKLPFVASWPIIFESGQYVRSLSTVYNY